MSEVSPHEEQPSSSLTSQSISNALNDSDRHIAKLEGRLDEIGKRLDRCERNWDRLLFCMIRRSDIEANKRIETDLELVKQLLVKMSSKREDKK